MSSNTSNLMRWHVEERVDDGILRHPADLEAWKSFDNKYSSFSADAQNIIFGLCTDGFNHFRNSVHDTWLVIMTIYNLPP